MAEKIWSQSEILEAIKSKAASMNLELFRARISRRAAQHLSPDILATFEDFNITHLTSPELWLPELFGGGIFDISLSHMSDVNVAIAAPYRITYSPDAFPLLKPSYADFMNLLSKPEWLGPLKLIFPRPPNAPGGRVVTSVTPYGTTITLPNGSTSTVGGPATPDLTKLTAVENPPEVRQEAVRLMNVQENLMRQERELTDKKTELQIASLKSDLQQQFQASRPMEGKNTIVETVVALAPFLMQFMQMQKESADRNIALQKEASDRHFSAQEAATARHLDMMKLVMEKPKDDLGGMAQMMGTMANVSMQIIQSNAEMLAASQPQQESPGYKLARQAMVALSGLMGNSKVAMLPDDENATTAALPEGAPPPGEEKRKYSQLELLERTIVRKDSKEKVAERFLRALQSKRFMETVRAQYGGNFVKMVEIRLGNWAAANAENLSYLQEIIPFIWEKATEAGLVNPVVKKAVEAPVEAPVVNGIHETPSEVIATSKVKKAPPAHV